jgi:predicted DNA-binding transcriptional regulator YafY
MPSNKNASYRYRLINHCLRNRSRKWTIDTLMEYISENLAREFDVKTGVSERSLRGDIALMRKDPPQGYGAPIVIRNRQVYYSDPNFSIHSVPLNTADLNIIHEATALLSQFNGLPHVEEMLSLLRKLDITENPAESAFVHISQNSQLSGLEHMRPLYDYIRRQQPINLAYQPFGNEDRLSPTLHPYLLKEFNNRWFLLGWSETDQLLRTYALDRIVSLEPAPVPWIPNTVLRPETYFRDIIGVTVPEDMSVQAIRLRFSPHRSPYILTKPLHPSQQTIHQHPDGSAEISLQVIVNPELRTLLLSFASDLEIIAPQFLREDISRELHAAMNIYKP